MARKSKIEPVREYLKVAVVQAKLDQDRLAALEDYEGAAMIKNFKDALERALELCGEPKSKEDKKENG